MRHLLFCIIILISYSTSVFADIPFRKHRASVFEQLEVTSESIVFIGNSITQGNEWCEAFDNHHILNRGISGALSSEVLENLPHFVKGNPKKVFLMIGINDGANPETVIPNTNSIVEYIQQNSPKTEIYIQSILPIRQNSDERRNHNVEITNILLKDLCNKRSITYIDLWSSFVEPGTNRLNAAYSNDGLHLLASGYAQWCNIIAPYVGSASVYADNQTNQLIETVQYPSQRASQFAALPIQKDDILMVGDLLMNTGEWHELFNNPRVKNRGIGVGYPNYSIKTFAESIPRILNGNDNQVSPAKIILQAGTTDAVRGVELSEMRTAYQALIDSVVKYAPSAEIYIQSLLPHHTKKMNDKRFMPFNDILIDLAIENEMYFIDIYAPFITEEGVCNSAYFNDMYLYGNGYLKLTELMMPIVTDEKK